ncbi:MAG: NUDIX hydrolase [Ignavibacteriae bacterium]|nr:NUDIX hydrolase [Ignavibacteriota bacterium]
MSLKPWKKLRQQFEIKNPWWTYRKDEVLLPSGKRGEYHFVHVKGSSMVIPVLDECKLILVNQYRYVANRESLEFPCGSVKEDSTHDETARLELAEETGFEAGELQCVAEFNPYNGVTDELCKVYIARHLKAVSTKPDDTEEFVQVQLRAEEFDKRVQSGEIWDGMTLAAWALVRTQFVK